jgi:hypothetical protein
MVNHRHYNLDKNENFHSLYRNLDAYAAQTEAGKRTEGTNDERNDMMCKIQ